MDVQANIETFGEQDIDQPHDVSHTQMGQWRDELNTEAMLVQHMEMSYSTIDIHMSAPSSSNFTQF